MHGGDIKSFSGHGTAFREPTGFKVGSIRALRCEDRAGRLTHYNEDLLNIFLVSVIQIYYFCARFMSLKMACARGNFSDLH